MEGAAWVPRSLLSTRLSLCSRPKGSSVRSSKRLGPGHPKFMIWISFGSLESETPELTLMAPRKSGLSKGKRLSHVMGRSWDEPSPHFPESFYFSFSGPLCRFHILKQALKKHHHSHLDRVLSALKFTETERRVGAGEGEGLARLQFRKMKQLWRRWWGRLHIRGSALTAPRRTLQRDSDGNF